MIGGIAVVGMACRFPGAPSLAAFWDLLCKGRDAIREVPPDRWKLDALYDENPQAPGKICSRWGGFLESPGSFDHEFFGISASEACSMDPQHRLVLELAWEALSDAGQVVQDLAESSVGVFVGISNDDYTRMMLRDLARINMYTATGGAWSSVANRVSYAFDLRGPSMAVDTACSSSLVAVHLACRSLECGDCSIGIAGGVNLILSPELTMGCTKMRSLAPDGRCKAFDARANGFVRSEGAGLVVLKPLAKAIQDRDRIYAVIRGSAVNQDGRSNGFTAPNRWAQESVIRSACQAANVSPTSIEYVETHGTGTPLGDAIEARALNAVLGEGRPPGEACTIGTVKTNIGHLESAAGIAGLIKTALVLHHGVVPPSLHYERPNPNAQFEAGKIRIATELMNLSGPLAYAGVSAFGLGGTNAHVILQRHPREALQEGGGTNGGLVLPLSAKTPAALGEMLSTWKDFLPAADSRAEDIVYTAAVRRDHHRYRKALIGTTITALGGALEQPAMPVEAPGEAVAVAQSYERGESVDWRRLYLNGNCVSIPHYPWQRRVCWFRDPGSS